MSGREHDPREPDDKLRHDRADVDVTRLHKAIIREHAEPTDGHEPVPITLIFGFLALAAWAGWYLSLHSGGWKHDVYDEDAAMTPSRGGAQVAAAPLDPLEQGRIVYNNCATCHGRDGRGQGGVFPPLAGSEIVNGPPERLARIVLGGLSGPIEVSGRSYNGLMPGWNQMLKDDQVAAVLTYIRQSWGNDAGAVEPELVRRLRPEAIERRGRSWTMEELDSAPPLP